MLGQSVTRRSFLGSMAAATYASAHGPIPIDAGRQLFVDDHLIAETTLERTYHQPRIHDGPVLKPETELEMNWGYRPVACPFEDGVFYDPEDELFKMWYQGGWFDGTCLATSKDGVTWDRPDFGIDPGTNRVIPSRVRYQRDGCAVWLDHDAKTRDERFKMFIYFREKKHIGYVHGNVYPPGSPNDWAGGEIYTSPDGIHWKFRGNTGPCGDNSGFFYDPFRKEFVYSLRTSSPRGRSRSQRRHADFVEGAKWELADRVRWQDADDDDRPEPHLGYPTQLYKVSCAPYESLMISTHQIHRGPPNEICAVGGFPKLCDLTIGYSRDGFNFTRPDRRSFIAGSREIGTWNRAYIHSAGGVCLVVKDELYFYFGTWSGISPRLGGDMYSGGSTGLAILRRDGFASVHGEGALTTKPVAFNGKYLFVNANTEGGELRVEVLDSRGNAIAPFTGENCLPVRGDSTLTQVKWRGGADLSKLRGESVKFRFALKGGHLYSFWVTPEQSGASHGYVAAGGPGLTGPTDTD